jgi:hypothetical protein
MTLGQRISISDGNQSDPVPLSHILQLCRWLARLILVKIQSEYLLIFLTQLSRRIPPTVYQSEGVSQGLKSRMLQQE